MIWSDWKALTSAGEINAALLPAEYFQLRYYVSWEYDIVEPSRMFVNLTGKWRWNIKDSGGGLLFDQENQTRVTVAWMYLGLGISIPTWWWDSSGNRITTYYPTPAETLGDDDFYLNPGGDVDPTFADPTVYVQSWYEGPIYQIALPSSSMLALPFHNVGALWLIKLANVQIRTAAAGGGDVYYDRPGFVRAAIGDSSALSQKISADDGDTWDTRQVTPTLAQPRIFKDLTNTLYCAGWQAKEYVLLYSENDGRTWARWKDLVIWETGYSDIDTACLRDGTVVSIARQGGYLWFRSSASDFAEGVRIGTATRAFMLTVGPQDGLLVATDGRETTFRSVDGGQSWSTVSGAF